MTALAYRNDRYIARRHLLKHLRVIIMCQYISVTFCVTFSENGHKETRLPFYWYTG